jgi:dihydrofolate reductase
MNCDNEAQLCWASTVEDALFVADIISICRGQDDIFIIGGETIYSLFDKLVNRIYLTEVFGEFPGDAFFDKTFGPKEWIRVKEEDFSKNSTYDDFSHRFSILQRRERRYRYEFASKFSTEALKKSEWLKSQIDSHKSNVAKYIEDHLDLNSAT